MIRINLLPVEYRRGNRISPKVLATAFGSALCVAASVGWFGVVYFGELSRLEREESAVTAELAQKGKKARYYDGLDSNRKDYALRVQTIQDIGKSRRVWSKFCDELIDVVNNNGDTERHLAWFNSLQVKTDARSKAVTITMPGAVEGGVMAKVANLHQDIEAAPFYGDVESKTPPSGKMEVDDTRVPAESFEFQLEMKLKALVETKKGKTRRGR